MPKTRIVRGRHNFLQLVGDVANLAARYPKANNKKTEAKLLIRYEDIGKEDERIYTLDELSKNAGAIYSNAVRKNYRASKRNFETQNRREPTSGYLNNAFATLDEVKFDYKKGKVIETINYKIAKELISELRIESRYVKSELSKLGTIAGRLALQRYNAGRKNDVEKMKEIDFERLKINEQRIFLRKRLEKIKEGIGSYQNEARAERAVSVKSVKITLVVSTTPLDSPEKSDANEPKTT